VCQLGTLVATCLPVDILQSRDCRERASSQRQRTRALDFTPNEAVQLRPSSPLPFMPWDIVGPSTMYILPLLLASAVTAAPTPGFSLAIGQVADEKRSLLKLRSFGSPEQKGGRWCRNGDETGVGDGKAGYAAVEVPVAAPQGLCEVRMDVWGTSDEFSFVAHNGIKYRTVGMGRPSGLPQWEEIRFILRPRDISPTGETQRFGFSSRDRQVWVSRFTFGTIQVSPEDRKALASARQKATGNAIVLAVGGTTDTTICIGPDPDPVLAHAAEELQRYILDMSSAVLAISTEPGERSIRLSVETSLFKNPDGFEVKTVGPSIAIVGGSPLGALYGAYAFLEALGCRWIHPGADGDVVPRHDPLVAPALDVHEEPDFRIRWVGQGSWALKNRCNVNTTVADERVGYVWKWGFHSFFGLLSPDKYWDEHPEYYPLVNGKRRRPENYSNTQFCTTNPDVIRIVADNIIDIFRKDPRIDIVALCPNDGGGFCTCPTCIALDRPKPDFWGRYSDRLAPFNKAVSRRVAEVFPDKILKTGAYAMYMRYPLAPEYRPEPNMAVQACHTYACNNHTIDDPNCERNRLYFRQPLEKWAELSEHLWIYEYYIKGAWAGLLYTQAHIMKQDIAYYKRIGAESFYTQWSAGAFGSVGLDFYLATRLVWDTSVDVDALVLDYCQAFYGAGGKSMSRFYQRLAQAFVESEDCISPFGYKRVWIAAPQVFTPKALADLERHLLEAGSATVNDVIRRRLEPTRVTFGYTQRAMAYLRAVTSCFDGIETPEGEAFAAAEAKAMAIGEAEAAKVVAYLTQHGLGRMVTNPKSKAAQLLRVHRNPRTAVPRWHGIQVASRAATAVTLPTIPGSRFVGRVAGHTRVRLDQNDEGLGQGWNNPQYDDSAWQQTPFPGYWQDVGIAAAGYRGLGWYRTSFTLPPKALPRGMRLMLRFEGVDAAARIYVNGQEVGEHAFVPGRSWDTPFEIDVTEAARDGENSLVLRVFTGGGKGGVYGRVLLYRLGDEPEDFMR